MHDSTAIFAFTILLEPDITDKIQYQWIGIVASPKSNIAYRKDPTGLVDGLDSHRRQRRPSCTLCYSFIVRASLGSHLFFQQHARAFGKNNEISEICGRLF
jgi:hypothetical protein